MEMILKNKMEKGAASTIILLVVGLMVLLGLSALLSKGSVSADPLSILQCMIAGGKDCQAEKGAEEKLKEDFTASMSAAVRCTYLTCFAEFGELKPYCNANRKLLEGLTWNGKTENCFEHCNQVVKKTGTARICGEDSQRNPIIISKRAETPKFIPVHPIDKPLDRMYVEDKCDTDRSTVNLIVDKRLLENQDIKKDCDEETGRIPGIGVEVGKGEFGKQKECRLKSNTEIYIYHKKTGDAKKEDHVFICSEKPLFANKTKEVPPKGPVTLFEKPDLDIKTEGTYIDMSEDTPDIENAKNFDGTSSVKLKSNYGATLYENPDYKGGCRIFFDSVKDLGSVGFNDKTKSVKVWQSSFKGAILYDKPLQFDGKLDQRGNNEYHPNKGEVVYLKTTDCVHQKAKSIEVSTDSIAILYEDTTLLFVTDKTTNLPQSARKATHIKVCKKDPTLPLEKNTCLDDDERFHLNKDLPSAKPPEPVTLKPNTCADGTEFDKCSKNKPTFCDNGNLISKASECGCPVGAEISGENCIGIKSFTCTVNLDCELPIVETSIGYVKLYDTQDRLIARYPCENNKCTLSGNFMKPAGTTYKIVVEWYGGYAEKSIAIAG